MAPIDGHFYTICHTCDEDHYSQDFDEADQFFREHATGSHEVETLNLASDDVNVDEVVDSDLNISW